MRAMGSPSFAIRQANGAATGTLRPRLWQQRLLALLRRRLSAPAQNPGKSIDVLIHAGPGAGKTLGSLYAFQQLRREGLIQGLCVCSHRSSISAQWLKAAASLQLELGEGQLGRDGLICSYQGASRDPLLLRQTLGSRWPLQGWLVVADEVHHLGLDPQLPDQSGWGVTFEQLSDGTRLRLGLTGTPFRADQLGFCAASQKLVELDGSQQRVIAPDLCVEPQELIASGDVRPLQFRFQDGWVEHARAGDGDAERSPMSAEQRETWRARNLRRAVRLGDPSSIGLRVLLEARRRREALLQQHPGAAGLVVARNIQHARGIGGLLEEEGDRVVLVHSQDPGAAAALVRFQQGEGDWLVSVDMCAEGFDAPRLRVVAYLTTVVTRSRFIQAITRAVRMDGERSALEPVPRLPSYIHAPADPLLMGYAHNWSLSTPYLLRPPQIADSPAGGGSPSAWRANHRAVADGAGEFIDLKGPQLPGFMGSGRGSVTFGQGVN